MGFGDAAMETVQENKRGSLRAKTRAEGNCVIVLLFLHKGPATLSDQSKFSFNPTHPPRENER